MNKRRQRRLRGKGGNSYQAGGEVGYGVSGPVMMAAALNSRSSDPDHAVEDAGPLASMPEGAPSTPDEGEQGYRRGGPVRKLGYAEGGDVEEEEEPDLPDEPEEGEEPEPPPAEEEPPAADGNVGGRQEGEEGDGGDQASPRQAGGQEQAGGDEGGDEEGGGGRGAPTGYNAPPKDQADRDPAALQAQEDAAQEPTGFRPQQARQDDPEQQLRDVLDWTRKQFGLDKGQHPQQQPQQQVAQVEAPAPGMRPAAQPQQPAVALPPPPSQAPAEGAPAEQRPPPAPAMTQPAQPAGGMPQTEQTPTQIPTPQARPPTAPSSAPQQLQQYLKGERSFTPEQMTQALDRATQENPHLDQSGSIRKAFQDLVGRGDMDGASRFVQALRPSYDNLRAAMVAATAQGKYVEALQIAERLNNLIPNGNQVSFHPTENGLITAVVRPESGEAARTYHLTPQQFHQYANGSGSVFDIAADNGIDATLQAAAQGPQTPPNPENAPPYQVAGPMMPPPEGPTRVQAPAETPLPQPRPAEAGPPATPESPLAQAQRTAAGLPGQAPTATPAPAPAAPPGGGDRVRQLEQQPTQQQPQRQAAPPATGYQPTTAGRVAPMAPGPQPREGETRTFPPRSEAPAGGKYPPSGGTLPTAPPYSARYNWDTGKWEPVGQARFNARSGQWEPTTGYQGGKQQADRQPGTFDPATNTFRPAGPSQPVQQQQGDPDKPGRQSQQPGQGQQPPPVSSAERTQRLQDAFPRAKVIDNPYHPANQQERQAQQQPPTTTGQRQPGQYTGTPEQKRQQYQQDLKEWELKERARQAYPHTADQDKRAKYEDTLRAREGTQQRHTERQGLEREKLDATNRRADAQIKSMEDRNAISNLKGIVVERERAAMSELRDRVNNAARANKDDPTYQYPYSDRDKQLIDKMHNSAVENDLADRLQLKLQQNPNSPQPRPTAPAAPGGQITPAAPKVDLEKYRGDAEPYSAPAGQQWGRSKSTGQWSLRPMERRPTVPMSQ